MGRYLYGAGILLWKCTHCSLSLSQCLQLLQRVTYGHRISFHESFVDDLIKYLVKQM